MIWWKPKEEGNKIQMHDSFPIKKQKFEPNFLIST